MRSWMLHLMAISGGAALLQAARGFQQLVVDPRTFTYAWGYFFLAVALQVLAGLVFLLPVLWARVRGEGGVRPHWGLVALYVLAGLVLAFLQPLQIVLGRSGFIAAADFVQILPTGTSPNIFGAFLIAIGIVYAVGRGPEPGQKPAER